MVTVRKDDVRVREHAHTLWEREGKPHGHNDEFWNRAHDEVVHDVELEALIREKAFTFWQEAGCPLWDAERFWFLAEDALNAEDDAAALLSDKNDAPSPATEPLKVDSA